MKAKSLIDRVFSATFVLKGPCLFFDQSYLSHLRFTVHLTWILRPSAGRDYIFFFLGWPSPVLYIKVICSISRQPRFHLWTTFRRT